MDAFKLLTRSTNLQKSAPRARKPQQQKIPSSLNLAVQKSPIEESEQEQGILQLQHQGKKRKRTTTDSEQIPPPSVNSKDPEKGTQTAPRKRRAVENENMISPSLEEHHIFRKDERRETRLLGEEECRRILKRNKVKITLLQSHDNEEHRSIDHSRAEDSVPKKNLHSQLSAQPLTSFAQLLTDYGISRRLAENLAGQGFKNPTEVQLGSLPLLLGSDRIRGLPLSHSRKRKKHENSHVDLLTVAPTGSGKTLAFMINVLHGLIQERSRTRKSGNENRVEGIQSLIIAPTHELADQIVNEGRKLAVGTGIRISAMKKGMRVQSGAENINDDGEMSTAGGNDDQRPQSAVKADVIVSTPMILLNALEKKSESVPTLLPTVRYLILDEADVLLDPLFRAQTLGIWHACTNPELQTSLWSATIGSSIESLAQGTILDRQRDLKLSSSSPHKLIRVIVGLKDSAIPNISHRLTYAATEHGKLLALRQLLHPTAPSDDKDPPLQPPFLVFTQTVQRATALHSELLYDIPPEAGGSSRIAVLHSDLSDSVRSAIMAGFRKGEIWVLMTTDLLSRGIDFRGMNGVVNYDIPNTAASYIHRAGRTGRQGREGGVAVTLYTKEDIPYLKNIANVIAASEKAKSLSNDSKEGDMQKWLLDALPAVSKKTKQELKRRGVQCRRTYEGKEGGKEARRTRISTKSGYDRRLENRRKAALAGSSKVSDHDALYDREASDEEWGGLDG